MGSSVAYLERTMHSKQQAVDAKKRELEQAERNYKDVLLKWGEARDAYKRQVQLRAEADRPSEPAPEPVQPLVGMRLREQARLGDIEVNAHLALNLVLFNRLYRPTASN